MATTKNSPTTGRTVRPVADLEIVRREYQDSKETCLKAMCHQMQEESRERTEIHRAVEDAVKALLEKYFPQYAAAALVIDPGARFVPPVVIPLAGTSVPGNVKCHSYPATTFERNVEFED